MFDVTKDNDWGIGRCGSTEAAALTCGARRTETIRRPAPYARRSSFSAATGGLLGGGDDYYGLCVPAGPELRTARSCSKRQAARFEKLTPVSIGMRQTCIGQQLYIKIVDNVTGGAWGHINVDDVRIYGSTCNSLTSRIRILKPVP